jgi:hypothetical protein
MAMPCRTPAGAQVDPMPEMGGRPGTRAVPIGRGLGARPQLGFNAAIEDIRPAGACVVHGAEDRAPLWEHIEARRAGGRWPVGRPGQRPNEADLSLFPTPGWTRG